MNPDEQLAWAAQYLHEGKLDTGIE